MVRGLNNITGPWAVEVNCQNISLGNPQETMQVENKPTAGFSYKGSRFGSPTHHKATLGTCQEPSWGLKNPNRSQAKRIAALQVKHYSRILLMQSGE